MIFKKMVNFFKKILLIIILLNIHTNLAANPLEFKIWLEDFKKIAIQEGISERTINQTISNSRFLPKVIEYDRYQPEFYEDTFKYIKKRTGKEKLNKGLILYKKNKLLIEKIEKKFNIEKELLLSLMGIETNFGNYFGKMDIISSLATLSFDKRRSKFFTNELIILLKLIDTNKIDKSILFGSWAGAFGNFQFMPSTIKNYAIDYDKNSKIELKDIEDSFASAANYLNKIGWIKNKQCFYRIELINDIPDKYLNSSAKNIINKKNFSFFKKYIKNSDTFNIDNNAISAIITPDIDIIPGAKKLTPAYIVFNNYELILKWNRSLRFALAVCTLKEKFKNAI